MERNELQAKWQQVKGLAREFWGELTGDELEFVAGQRERLVGKLQEKYGWSEEEAERQVDELLKKL